MTNPSPEVPDVMIITHIKDLDKEPLLIHVQGKDEATEIIDGHVIIARDTDNNILHTDDGGIYDWFDGEGYEQGTFRRRDNLVSMLIQRYAT
jgi:hypothetical protein